MDFRKNLLAAAVLAPLVAILGACDDGPAEDAGEVIDETAEEAGEAAEEAGEAAEEAAD